MDFGNENGGFLATKINEKTISTSKSDFVGFVRFPFGENRFFHIFGGRSWKKNLSKIDEKSKSRWEGILALTFK